MSTFDYDIVRYLENFVSLRSLRPVLLPARTGISASFGGEDRQASP